MISIIGAILLLIVAVLEVALVCGAPLGEYTMGGKHKVLPPPFRIADISSILAKLIAVIVWQRIL